MTNNTNNTNTQQNPINGIYISRENEFQAPTTKTDEQYIYKHWGQYVDTILNEKKRLSYADFIQSGFMVDEFQQILSNSSILKNNHTICEPMELIKIPLGSFVDARFTVNEAEDPPKWLSRHNIHEKYNYVSYAFKYGIQLGKISPSKIFITALKKEYIKSLEQRLNIEFTDATKISATQNSISDVYQKLVGNIDFGRQYVAIVSRNLLQQDGFFDSDIYHFINSPVFIGVVFVDEKVNQQLVAIPTSDYQYSVVPYIDGILTIDVDATATRYCQFTFPDYLYIINDSNVLTITY